MTYLSGSELISIFEREWQLPQSKSPLTLYIVLGLLGDFDSFEYIQALTASLPKLINSGVKLKVFGIGNNKSKEYFCKYTQLPSEFIQVKPSNKLHQTLSLNTGLNLQVSPLVNLTLMCLGFNSPGTLSEVMRGYIGDRKGEQVLNRGDKISFFNKISFNTNLFNLIGKEGVLAPFELASLRLLNMSEVLSNWETYMIDTSLLTQRNGTFLIDINGELRYSYRSKGLLGYSENMSDPLSYLSEFL